MKIDLNAIDRSLFLVEENVILSTGDTIYFVRPKPGAQGLVWTQKNKYFRSSIWDKTGELISAGFPKFEDLGINTENFPSPTSLDGAYVCAKLDGALLIISKFKRHKFIRTRGTLDAESSPNGKELSLFKRKILSRLEESYYGEKTWNFSLLFEWLSPNHKLVINYGEQPRFVLVGFINHSDYSLVHQLDLDQLARGLKFERPQIYKTTNLESLVKDVKNWTNEEGVVIYTNNGQSISRLKSNWYCVLHKLRTDDICIENVIDSWFVCGKLSYNDFLEKIAKQFEPEFAEKIRSHVSIICDAWKEVQKILSGFSDFCNTRLFSWRRTEAEEEIYKSFGKTNRAEYVLKTFLGKPLDDDELKKLLYQCIKRGK